MQLLSVPSHPPSFLFVSSNLRSLSLPHSDLNCHSESLSSYQIYFLPSEDDIPEFDEPAKRSFQQEASEGDLTWTGLWDEEELCLRSFTENLSALEGTG